MNGHTLSPRASPATLLSQLSSWRSQPAVSARLSRISLGNTVSEEISYMKTNILKPATPPVDCAATWVKIAGAHKTNKRRKKAPACCCGLTSAHGKQSRPQYTCRGKLAFPYRSRYLLGFRPKQKQRWYPLRVWSSTMCLSSRTDEFQFLTKFRF